MRQPRFGWVPGKEDYRPLRTLLDCARFKLNLRMTCRACGHSRVVDAPSLWWLADRKGWDDAIPAIAKRCYCEPCWTERQVKVRGPAIVQTSDAADDLVQAPDARDWKRVVNRHRS
ncbi:hypothetical protein [Novosphingobium sp. Gsoil 351]|uniref:hypothetical protein n=1 Tax=Novosphingobium sp. Gsoil 351 TaxID=2675225 RepID=UPI0012B4B5D0|nr:hypothetical protein [Novosphingobium sp. Gsoil 351]QGN54067.1 hypothetical protein GKE62_05445 [Novosphingobium sp. Gsoil 351]